MSAPLRRRVAVELLGIDTQAFRTWLRHVRAVEASLGRDLSRAYSGLVLTAARRDLHLGRDMARLVPDQLARVRRPSRGEYLALMDVVLTERPEAAVLVCRTLPELFERLQGESLRDFLFSGLERHDDGESKAAHFLRR